MSLKLTYETLYQVSLTNNYTQTHANMAIETYFVYRGYNTLVRVKRMETEYKVDTGMFTLKAPRKIMHLKTLSAEVVCCKQSPNITDDIIIEANSVDQEQTAPI